MAHLSRNAAMKPFNVTLIHPEGYIHAAALTEAAQYIYSCLRAGGFEAELTTNKVRSSAHNIVIGAHMFPAEACAALPGDTIIFNSEQLNDRGGWPARIQHYPSLLERFHVWDYSLRNLPAIPHERKSFIPFLYSSDLVRADLPRSDNRRLCFYGSLTERRKKLLKEIEDAGVPVDVMFGKYGAERDAAVFSSWAVLNISNSDDLSVFEPVRCFYPLINNVPVISEISVKDPTFALYRDYLFAFETQKLVTGIAHLYKNPDEFRRVSQEKLAGFRETSGVDAVADAVAHYRATL